MSNKCVKRERAMKIEDLLFAMSDDRNDFMEECHGGGCVEADEGIHVFMSRFLDATCHSMSLRRAKSTPNLLQLPTLSRTRKKSDDSAVGSAEESEESFKYTDSYTGSEPSEASEVYNANKNSPLPSPDIDTDESELATPTKKLRHPFTLLRPPSVVISHHEQEARAMTLDDLDAEFNLKNQCHSRRVSNASSTCSSFSFSDSDLALNTLQVEDETPQFEVKKKCAILLAIKNLRESRSNSKGRILDEFSSAET